MTHQHPEAKPGPAAQSMIDSPEGVLVTAARRADERAVRELVRRYNPRLFRIARGIVDSDAEAEDVVQEAYLAAFTRLSQFRGEAAFSTWLTRITINAARMHRRRLRPEESYDSVSEDSPETVAILPFPGSPAAERPEAGLGRAQLRALLERAVAELPGALRLPFLLHEVEGLSVRHIAQDLSLNPITVKTRLFRARRRLRAAIEAEVRGGFDAIFPFAGSRCAGMAERVVAELRARGRL